MKYIFTWLTVLFLLTGCFGTGPDVIDPAVDTQINFYRSKVHNEIAILPTYKYLGTKSINIETSKAIRTYHLWKDQGRSKYVLITILTPKHGTLPKDYNWVDKRSAITSHGNIATYNSVHPRVKDVISQLDGPLPDCFILASEFYFNEKEVMYKALIVPDKMCFEIAEPVIQELNRTANMQ